MSFDAILLYFFFLPSLVLSVVDVIVKTGEGALEVFQLLLENCQEPENKGDLSISVITISMAIIIMMMVLLLITTSA